MRTNEDIAFNLIAMECSENKGYLDETLYLFRRNLDSITRKEGAPMDVVSIDYITALYYVSKYMMERFGDVTYQVLVDIFAVYNFYQTGLILGLITDEIKEQVRYMLKVPSFSATLNNTTALEKVFHVPN